MRDRGGCVSIPVARRTRASKHCRGSTLPDELRGQGYDVAETDEGERILPTAITEMVITEGSTSPIKVAHAGIVKVERFTFDL